MGSEMCIRDSLYGTCKDSLRRISESWAEQNDLSLAWARLFCPFGAHEKENRLIPKLIAKLQSADTIPFDSGNLVRDFLDVRELGSAFAALFDSPVTGAINLSSGEATSIREIFITLAHALGKEERIALDQLPDPAGQVPRIVASVSRLHNEVGWQPQQSITESLTAAADWWTNHSKAISQ